MATITAKFPSTCPNCKTHIAPGTRVNWTRGQRAEHVKCPPAGTVVEVTVELDGDALRARRDDLEQRMAKLRAVQQDEALSKWGDKPSVCPHCQGKGLLTMKINVSDTLDYSDWQTFATPCPRTAAKLDYEYPKGADRYALPYLTLDGIMATDVNGGRAGPTAACVAEGRAADVWERNMARERMAIAGRVGLVDLNYLHGMTVRELVVRVGDEATVINRGKEYTGPVVWIGEDSYGYTYQTGRRASGGEMRVKVVVGGKRVGGALQTAKLVKRTTTMRVSVIKPQEAQ